MTEEPKPILLKCSTCRLDKPLDSFGPNRSESKRHRYFKQNSCIECTNENARLKRGMQRAINPKPVKERLNRIPYPEVREYLIYMATQKTDSRSTMAGIMNDLHVLLTPIRQRFGIERMSDISPEHVLSAYETIRRDKEWGFIYCNKIIGDCRRFFAWLVKERKAMDGFVFPQVSFPKPVQQTPMVVTPATLFSMRQLSKIRMECAVALEIVISSGLRPGEILNNLAPCQIDFNRHPVELSTGKPSPYSGGMIRLDSSRQIIKRGRSRVTFMSKAAARILKRYMTEVGLKESSKIPLFPYANNVFNSWLEPFKVAFPELRGEEVTHQLGKKLEAEDLLDDEELSQHFRDRLKTGVKLRNQFQGPVDPHEGKEIIDETKGLHWHSFRHTAACYLYYKNYYNQRQDVDRVRLMLGHNDEDTTYIYLSQLALIKDDDEWAQIYLGRASDWSRVKRLGREGSYD